MKNIGVSTNDISHISRIYKILGSETRLRILIVRNVSTGAIKEFDIDCSYVEIFWFNKLSIDILV